MTVRKRIKINHYGYARRNSVHNKCLDARTNVPFYLYTSISLSDPRRKTIR